MKTIPLTRGFVALVDDADFEMLCHWRWCYTGAGYAQTYIGGGHRGRRQNMHRMIMLPDSSQEVDHVNGNRLDNRRANLRLCCRSQNNMNQRKTRGSSRFKGVSWNKQRQKWAAYIKVHGLRRHLGLFIDEEAAARTYDCAAVEHFDEFACLNFPEREIPADIDCDYEAMRADLAKP